MISAVAARKAALAAQRAATEESSSISLTPLPPSTPTRINPKRKPSSQKSQPEKKKLKSKQPKSKSTSRHQSSTDVFKEQEDVIIMDSGESSDEDMSVLEDSDQDPVDGQSREERAWSPSQSVGDSSDDSMEVDGEGVAQLDISSFFNKAQPQEDLDENRLLSTFEPSPDENMFFLTAEERSILNLSGAATLIALNAQDSLCLLGTCSLTILHGSITLCGVTLLASSTKHPIYAPRSSPLPVIRASSKTASALGPDILSPRLVKILEYKAVIILQELRTNVEDLGRICRSFEGVFEPTKWQKSVASGPFEIPGLYMITRQTKDIHPFFLPFTWSAALENLSNSNSPADLSCGRYLVKGPQKCGKSTFARTLMNHLLGSYRRVAFLECDLGQSEFTPGGMVSLNIIENPIFGPPFTHPTLPNIAHFIGAATPRSSPTHYLDAAMALIQSYRLDIQTPDVDPSDEQDPRTSDVIPLVVNTMGWSKGLGADLTQRIEDMVEPTDIFDVKGSSNEQYNNNERSRYAAYSSTSMVDESLARLHELQAVISSSSAAGYTPADHRALSILSYFHARFPLDITLGQLEQITAHSWDTGKPLCAIPPYELDCTIAIDKVILTGAGSEDVVEEEVDTVLNGAIVGLVRCDPGTIDVANNKLSTGINYTRHLGPPSPSSSNCVGLALIRGISPPTKTYLQILTPLPYSLLACARVFVKGEMELPVWGMLDFRNFNGVNFGDVAGVERDKVPFLQWGKGPSGAMGADKRRVRRNLMRRGQM